MAARKTRRERAPIMHEFNHHVSMLTDRSILFRNRRLRATVAYQYVSKRAGYA
ncbi:hypothetical protein AZ22_2836 [Bordetella bronchiseptica 980-2]|nr:hypothetical protein AZ22_2836 [Bordetella bronchiseptica 980-2]KCV47136.1 hypothetical protein L491_2838 [Bordetella bronchiseptica 3E44]KCV56612.1 hypothetical protein AZ14_2908 [Bordetella bronchiseptica 980]KDB61385.1 hypothetical protein AZ15_2962 [Bordetella bronchiseptica A1-7]KDB66119.1 hypothetical protein AZ21_2937 [Bordetella bronchiseptica B20-10725633]KDB89401.1 hypothetical protein AZ27_2803 [Bordetella bronchiseptica D756]KDB91579.1 hypothetical protein AZ17_2902 [Bordetella